MTITVGIKVNDGIVLAADSATTITGQAGGVAHIYNNACKIVNLCRDSPIGIATWGNGGYGSSSIATIAKAFRRQLAGPGAVDQIKDIAGEFLDYLYNDHYVPNFGNAPIKPTTGFMIAGFSSNANQPELLEAIVDGSGKPRWQERYPGEQVGMLWGGQGEAISRLILGHAPELPTILDRAGVDAQMKTKVMNECQLLTQSLITPPMPIQDTIDAAEFLVDLTVRFVKYKPGSPTVGGPIEIATITRHEGFKWIKRKLYYSRTLNP